MFKNIGIVILVKSFPINYFNIDHIFSFNFISLNAGNILRYSLLLTTGYYSKTLFLLNNSVINGCNLTFSGSFNYCNIFSIFIESYYSLSYFFGL